jgi:hypothetical protein
MGMVPEQNMEKHIEKQMGCMVGFLQPSLGSPFKIKNWRSLCSSFPYDWDFGIQNPRMLAFVPKDEEGATAGDLV